MLPPGSSARRLLVIASLLAAALVACGRELVAPTAVPVSAFHRTGSLAINPQYESPLAPHALRAALLEVAFDRVRITLRRDDGSVALDTVVLFPAGADSLTLTLNVPLPAATPSTGVPLSLNLGYVNAAGDTVFRGGPVLVTVVPTASAGGTPAPSVPVQIPVHYTGTGATAAAVVISPKSFAGTPGQSATFTGRAIDASGNTIAGTPIVFTSSNEGVVSINANSGAATLVGRGTAKVYALLLTGKADSAVVSVTLPASQLALVGGANQTAPAGSTLPTAVSARVLANDGVGVAGTTVTFAASGGGTVTPASAVSDASGNVSTQWKLGPTAGAQTLTIAAAGLSGSPLTVNATAQAVTPTKLTVLAQPANGTAGASLGAVTVAAQDAAGTTIAAYTGDVSVAIGANPGSATLSGTTTVKAVNGIATFSDLKLNRPGNGYTLAFSASGLSPATSAAFSIAAGSAARLVFGAMPASVDAGIAISPAVTVTAQDSAGNPVTSFTGAVTVAIGTNPGGATLGGTLTKNAVAGVASFDNLSINKSGAAYTLTATATGMASATSAAFNVAPGVATVIAVISGGGQTAAAGSTVPVVFQVRDALGNPISGITLTFAVTSGGGSLSGSSGVTDASGQASVGWTLGPLNGAQAMTASAIGLPTTTVSATATGGSTNALAISTPPSATQTAGVTFSPTVVVQAKDALGAVVTAFTGAVTASVATGPSGATIGGTATVNAVAGVASFNALRLTKAGVYTIQFAASGYASATTTSITVNPAPAKTIAADSGNAQTGAASTALPVKLVVLVTDSLGNPVSAAPVAWAVATGGGSLSGTTTATDANGRARATFTLGVTPGAQSATATSSGLTGSPVTFTATAQGVIATTTVTPQRDTIVSFGATRALAAQAKDGAGGNMTGTFAWVSRTPSVATVNASTGLVTAVANGSTYIVATEAGGTKDSALIVVQQRVATINVTPGTRNIYKSRNYAFTAAAVDGMGNAMPGITSFTWSTVTPSVATVDTAGRVTAVALGSTQVRATNGAITGVANVTVLTPITRIVVGRDSSGVPVTDTTSLTSLGVGRAFRAEAHDTLDAVMSGVTFTWTSTNPTVALLDTTQATRAHVLTNANGNTTIQAVADGVTGSALLNVQQVLSSIELGPTPSTIGVSGTVQLTARGKDANGRYLSSGTFSFSSSASSVASVNAASGVVTGVALGTANITATSGSITSNAAVVNVSSVVPPIISFGRDTLTVGRGSSTSIPILLSRTNATNVTVNLAARDTVAYFSSASVTIPAGQTSANVTLNGRNAGTTLIYATDGSGTGYTGDTAAVAVQANMRMAQSYWYLNAGDQVASQVLLSDPSPAGGTFVTFSYGTAGKAQVSPDPAFIPAGQLASNVVITALGSTTGNTTITPVATGVNGTASTLNVSAPVLSFSGGSAVRLGVGQYDQWYVSLPNNTVNALPLTFVSSDTNIVTVPAAGAVPAGSYYFYFNVTGKALGTATVTVSSPGWTSAAFTVTVSSPRTVIGCCIGTLQTTSPTQSFTVYAEDSLFSAHYRTSTLAMTVSSSDTTVIKILDKTPVIAAGSYYTSGIRYQPGGSGGTAYIKVVAGGHKPDSMLVTVVGPKLEFSWCCTNNVAKGSYDQNVYVYAPNSVTSPLTVTLTSANPAKVSVPATVTIPTGSYYAYFNVTGVDTTGPVAIIASAPGYQYDTAYYRVTSPKLSQCCNSTLNNFGPGTNVTVYAVDTLNNSHYRSTPLTVTLTSSNPSVITVDSGTVTIGTGSYYANTPHVSVVGTGSAYIKASAPGFIPDSTLYTVVTPKLNFSFYSTTVGRRQFFAPTNFYVYTPDNRASPLTVTITQSNAAADSLTATSLTVPTSSYYSYFGLAGRATGSDVLIATAPGYLPDTAFVTVTSPKLSQCCMPSSALTTSAPSNITVYAVDSLGNSHYVLDTLVLRVTSSDTTVIKPTQPYVRIPAGGYYVSAGFAYYGPGTANLTFTDSAGSGYGAVTTSNVTVTGPSLIFSNTNAVYGMRQHGWSSDYYVYTQNNVTSPVTVNLVSTDPRVATVPASVTIPTGSYYAYFTITAQDTVGTIQIQANAVGFGPPTPITVQVTQPKFVISTNTSVRTTQGPQTITVYAADANGNAHYTNENVTVALASSAAGVAAVDSTSVTIPAGAYYVNTSRWSPVAVGTAQLQASDARAALYKYNTATANLSVYTPTLSLSWGTLSLGKGQYFDQAYECCTYVSTPDNMAGATTIALGHAGTAKTTVPATVTIPASSYYAYFRITANSFGTDTLTASAASPFHNPATAYVVIDSGRVDNFSGWPSASMHVGDSVLVTLQTKDPGGSNRHVAAATTFTISAIANIEFHVGGTTVTSVTVPADAAQVQFYVKATATGTGTATFTNANYHTYSPPGVTVIP